MTVSFSQNNQKSQIIQPAMTRLDGNAKRDVTGCPLLQPLDHRGDLQMLTVSSDLLTHSPAWGCPTALSRLKLSTLKALLPPADSPPWRSASTLKASWRSLQG